MTNPTIPDLQQELAAVQQIGQAASAPFVHSAQGQATVQKVSAEVSLGIAALPLLASLFQNIGGIFHHMHAVATAATAPAVPPANPPVA